MSRAGWARLTDYLRTNADPDIVLTFEQVERIMAEPLPGSARRHAAFWSNSSSYARAWRDAEFEVSRRGLLPETVRFLRTQPSSSSFRVEAHTGTASDLPDKPTPAAQDIARETPADVVLVGCVKTKGARAAPAQDLYISDLFVKRRSYAEKTGLPWYILSAEHGLLRPMTLVEPYDVALKSQARSYRRAWGVWVAARLQHELGSLRGRVFEVHAGDAYVEAIKDPLRAVGARITHPVARLGIGEQRAWYGKTAAGDAQENRECQVVEQVQPVVEPDESSEATLLWVELARRLRTPELATPLGSLSPSHVDALPGLYSWWVDDTGSSDLSTGLGHQVGPGLIYAGQAGATRWPSGRRSGNTLRARLIGMHSDGNVKMSTFRFTLAALLGLLRPDGGADEGALSAWMYRHLAVNWVMVSDPDALGSLERAVLHDLDPPLNLAGMPATPIRQELTRLRLQRERVRTPAPPTRQPSSESSNTLVPNDAIKVAIRLRLARHSNWGLHETEWHTLLRELVDRMEERARQQSGWVYSDLVKGTALENRHGWHHTITDVLVVVAQAVHRCELPMLTAVVWGKATGSPGPGFNKAARYLGRQGEGEEDLAAWVRELNAVHETWGKA